MSVTCFRAVRVRVRVLSASLTLPPPQGHISFVGLLRKATDFVELSPEVALGAD